MIKIALGLPHTPWIPERVVSLERLMEQITTGDEPAKMRIFDERATNKVWPIKMWRWGLETGATHFLTLQDDVLVSPDFWPTLRAMIEANPLRILGLSAVHPLGPEMARQGHRWYRTKSWLVGWAYVLPREDLAEFVGHVDANPEEVAAKNEDQMLNDWILATGRDCWQPVPSPVDHDTSIASTYSNDDHSHRRTTVTWRGYRREDLVSADWWRSGPGPLLPLAWQSHCWACGVRPAVIKTKETSVAICGQCLGSLVGAVGARLGGMLHGPGAAT